jgi:hypothetical protein
VDGAFRGACISRGDGVAAAPAAVTGGVGSVGLKLVAPAGIRLSLVLKRGAASGVLAIPPPVLAVVFAAGMF